MRRSKITSLFLNLIKNSTLEKYLVEEVPSDSTHLATYVVARALVLQLGHLVVTYLPATYSSYYYYYIHIYLEFQVSFIAIAQ